MSLPAVRGALRKVPQEVVQPLSPARPGFMGRLRGSPLARALAAGFELGARIWQAEREVASQRDLPQSPPARLLRGCII